MSKLIEEAMARWLDPRWTDQEFMTVNASDLRALCSSWLAQREMLDIKEAELDAISASHKDLAHRLARMGEVLT